MNDLFKYYFKNNFLTQKKYREIDHLYHLSDEKLFELYNNKFIRIFNKAINKSTFYQKLYSEYGIGAHSIKDINDIVKLPVLEKSTIKEHVDDIYIGFDFMKVKGFTSGTTGTPLTVYRTATDIAIEQAYINHYRKMHGFNSGQPLLSIRGVLGKNTTHHHFKKANILYISSPNINENTIDMYYELVIRFGPVAIEAYPSYLHKFCIELEKKGLQLHVKNCFTSSETLMGFQRNKIEQILDTDLHDWYGNTERTILLAQNKTKEYYPLPLYSINEFNENNLITTSLINEQFPLIRYKVEDNISTKNNNFKENILHPKIEKINGRSGDLITLKDGSVVGCIDNAFKGINNLEWAQIYQFDVHQPIEVKIVVNTHFNKTDEEKLRSHFIRMIGVETDLVFIYAKKEDLVFSKNGKYQLIIKKRPA